MGIFSRLAQLIKSNLNDLISKSEDPEKMLNQVVLDMNAQLVEAKKQVASSIADEKRLLKQFEQETANAEEWERRAGTMDRQMTLKPARADSTATRSPARPAPMTRRSE